ncbi:hypothetical protein A2V49_02455 [candidate division WWE3 bacterium RBG_19FT_COMBO_34_6]|uniref:Uncharacterized protein n=1 Tax=candidate division WWE3 bacterium RBG_19FT_COMBO_34_6 TaxID=1802612 RepID=A0A1F4UJL2_UNCKA|nr:MAG: hypothetical protein A2V49_02455 [candidate division WWE3 bacterium RBG_19FT_COMBO_34_6]
MQEYYQLEWYWAYANYEKNMDLVRELFLHIANSVYQKTQFEKNGLKFDLSDKWEKIDYAKIINDTFGVDVLTVSEEEVLNILKKKNVKLPGLINRARLIDNLWKLIRKDVAGPAFLINQPKFISPLAKSVTGNENFTERFQVIVAGSELGNGYSELNDPFDQLERFKDQQNAREAGDEEAQMMDVDFVEMLEYGMPPTSGYGQSERIFWFLEGITGREGTLFPQLRKKIDDINIQIYGLKDPNIIKTPSKTRSKEKITINKKDALMLLNEHVKDEYQKLHAFMVANAMEAYAHKLHEDPDLWYITGLIHDLDYFNYPTEHPNREIEWLENWGYPEEMIHAITAHAHRTNSIEPLTPLANMLLAIDELAGFLYAYSLMRPDGFENMDGKSVKKKFKDKAFAKKIDRDDIIYGIEKSGVDFDEHVEFLISVFKKMGELKK